MPEHEYAQYWFSPRGKSIGINEHITKFCYDEAYMSYSLKLKEFILSCAVRLNDDDGTPLKDDVAQVENTGIGYISFAGRRHMYHHPVLHVRYLTFSGKLGIDVLLKGVSFMIRDTCNSSGAMYKYGQIVEMFTVRIQRPGNLKTELLDILFVRWYEVDDKVDIDTDWDLCPHSSLCPRRLRFAVAGKEAFGFMKPSEIVRKVSVVPDVMRGFTTNNLGPSYGRAGEYGDRDYKFYRLECLIDFDLSLRLHCKPSTYYLLCALEAPDLKSKDVLNAVPWFLQSNSDLKRRTDEAHNSEQSKVSPYPPSTVLELANISDIREDDSYFIQGYFQ